MINGKVRILSRFLFPDSRESLLREIEFDFRDFINIYMWKIQYNHQRSRARLVRDFQGVSEVVCPWEKFSSWPGMQVPGWLN